MPAPTNLGFETRGGVAGHAESWNVRAGALVGSSLLAGYGAATFAPIVSPSAFNTADWSKTNLSVTANTTVAPDGTTTAETFTDNGTNGLHLAATAVALSFEAGKTYGIGAHFKAGAFSRAAVGINAGGTRFIANIDVVDGRVDAVSAPSGVNVAKLSAQVETLPNGWFRATLFFEVGTAFSASPEILMLAQAEVGTATTYAGVGSTIFVWGAFAHVGALSDVEAFSGGWSNDAHLFALTIPTNATNAIYATSFVDPLGFESFESGWANYPFLPSLSTKEQLSYGLGPVSQSLNATGLPIPIPDSPGPIATISIVVPLGTPFGQITTDINISHTFRGDLIVKVIAPNGVEHMISNQAGGGADDVIVTDVDMTTTFAALRDEAGGTWTLSVDDEAGGDIGQINSWNLEFRPSVTTEDFEDGWSNDTFILVLTAPTAAAYDTGTPENFEDFEEQWLNSPYLTTISSSSFASYDGAIAPENVEDFEETLFDKEYTADPTTDVLTSASHGLVNGQTVTLRNVGGAPGFPAGLNKNFTYYVVGATTNTLQLSLTSGGAAIDITSAGDGANYLRGDPSRYWNSADRNTTL